MRQQLGMVQDIQIQLDMYPSGDLDNPEWLKHNPAKYLIETKTEALTPSYPVAYFHLSNGALIENIHTGTDFSANGANRLAGVMVKHLYDLKKIDKNQKAYATEQKIVVSREIKSLLSEKDTDIN
ncbi:MAG: malonyl-CoA decarboxylase family protein [Pseudomonadota bacterium]